MTLKIAVKSLASAGVASVLFTTATVSHAVDNGGAFGLTYSTGFEDVVDWHDDHLSADITDIPVGVSGRFVQRYDSGLRMDAGIGPIAVFYGDIDYYDVPLQLTGGFTLFKDAIVRPYLRAGVTYHINDGDYVEDSAGLGLMGAVGLEIGSPRTVSFFAEVSFDNAEATFSTAEGDGLYVTSASKKDIEISSTQFTLGVTF
jgi:hypothetical protein